MLQFNILNKASQPAPLPRGQKKHKQIQSQMVRQNYFCLHIYHGLSSRPCLCGAQSDDSSRAVLALQHPGRWGRHHPQLSQAQVSQRPGQSIPLLPPVSKFHPLPRKVIMEEALKYATLHISHVGDLKNERQMPIHSNPPSTNHPRLQTVDDPAPGRDKSRGAPPSSFSGGGEGRKRFAVPKAKPTPELRLGTTSELGVAPGRTRGPTCGTRPPASPPPEGDRAAPQCSQPEGPPLPAERGQAGPRPAALGAGHRGRPRRAEPSRAGPRRPRSPPHTHLSPALRQQPRPSGGEAPHTNTHRSPRERGTHTAGSGPGSPTPPPFPLRRGSTVPRRSATRTALPPRSGATAHLRVSAGRWRLAAGSPRLQAQGHAAGDVITQRWAGHCAGDVIAQEGEGHARALGARFRLPRLGAVGPFRLEKSAELSAWRHPALPLQR